MTADSRTVGELALKPGDARRDDARFAPTQRRLPESSELAEREFRPDRLGERDGELQEVLPDAGRDVVPIEELGDVDAADGRALLVEDGRRDAERRVVELRVMLVGRHHDGFARDERQARCVRAEHRLAAVRALADRDVVEVPERLGGADPREQASLDVAHEGDGAELVEDAREPPGEVLEQLDHLAARLEAGAVRAVLERRRHVPVVRIQPDSARSLPGAQDRCVEAARETRFEVLGDGEHLIPINGGLSPTPCGRLPHRRKHSKGTPRRAARHADRTARSRVRAVGRRGARPW